MSAALFLNAARYVPMFTLAEAICVPGADKLIGHGRFHGQFALSVPCIILSYSQCHLLIIQHHISTKEESQKEATEEIEPDIRDDAHDATMMPPAAL
ncbi:hypothetical protein N7508_010249 [Penicillium antarcticum]|uniref:uncharacterized protein n=1 Tax=Penicillium antarcticum TaxID=416450 RepID=UPI0023866394|nr:uncharacterized protein N7508_010249 [Penicillium antarcticum]KAJ5295428.1 hypothetical protein N7508_010249 [Penicillium antarcticum]